MTNWRANTCPKCGNADQIDVAATVWVRLTMDGSDADEPMRGDHEYDDDSEAACGNCGYEGKLSTFVEIAGKSEERTSAHDGGMAE